MLALALVVSPAQARKKAGPAKKKKVALNMPKGWSWPPSTQMKKQGARCLKDLDKLGVNWKAGAATRKVTTPVVVGDMTFGKLKLVPRYGKGPWVMDCHLAQSLARFASPALSNMHVVEIRFGQIHKYREVAGKPGVLSRHSLGLAMDVYGFVTDDGVAHVVKDDYLAGDEVLLEVEQRINESGAFRLLLTPGNDPDRHDDHFHFEARVPGDKQVTKPAPRVEAEADEEVLGDQALVD